MLSPIPIYVNSILLLLTLYLLQNSSGFLLPIHMHFNSKRQPKFAITQYIWFSLPHLTWITFSPPSLSYLLPIANISDAIIQSMLVLPVRVKLSNSVLCNSSLQALKICVFSSPFFSLLFKSTILDLVKPTCTLYSSLQTCSNLVLLNWMNYTS